MQILALDSTGSPRNWLSANDAITHYALGKVVWEMGEPIVRYRGGINRLGEVSEIVSSSIIAIRGKQINLEKAGRVRLTNRSLYVRDRYVCAYCSRSFPSSDLSRDHIIPRSKGGTDDWMNVVTACKKCNTKKGDKTLSQVGFDLHYVPYRPNHFERLILENKNIRGDQMEFLKNFIPEKSRIINIPH